jgi:hypothetical protein
MSIPTIRRSTVLFASILVLALPIISFAQGRGNGKGNGGGPNLDKKCAKFVNCHDARDGRWDGRGPAVNPTVNPVFNPGGPLPPDPNVIRHRRNRDEDSNDEVLNRRSRNRRVDRNGNVNTNGSGNTNGDRTWRRHRRTTSSTTETRDRRVHRNNRNNVD